MVGECVCTAVLCLTIIVAILLSVMATPHLPAKSSWGRQLATFEQTVGRTDALDVENLISIASRLLAFPPSLLPTERPNWKRRRISLEAASQLCIGLMKTSPTNQVARKILAAIRQIRVELLVFWDVHIPGFHNAFRKYMQKSMV